MKPPARLLQRRSLLVLALGTALALPAATLAQTPAAQTLASKLEWRSVGPYVGGRVVAVAGVPSEPNLFYMGAVDGGVWKSTDYGLHWTNISDKTLPGSSNSIGAIAVAPSDAKVIYVGTGESDIRGDMIPGDGVFKSTDAGKTWQAAGLADTHSTMSIVVDPHNPDVVYVASMGHVFVPDPNRGVFKSTDGGQTWQKVLFVNDSTGVVDLVMDPQNPDVLYAAAWQAYRTPFRLMSGGAGSGIYKSTDGGAHWTNISKSQGLPAGPLGKIGVAVAPSDPSVLYTAIQAKAGGVFRSNDGGATWTQVNDEMKLRQRAFYYMAIFVDPKDPNTVYMPQVDGVYTSHDGGKTFRPVRPPHGDNHIIWVNPNDTRIMLEGNDGGATVSTDGGKSWSQEHNQPTGQFYHVNLDDQFPFHIYGAQQDEGSTDGPSASPSGSIPLSEWQRVAYGESTFVVPEPGDPNIAFGSGYFSIFMKSDLSTGELQEVSPWPLYREGASSGELKYRFAWTHPILFSPVNTKELLVGSQYVLKSDDYGVSWQRISPDLSRNDSSTEAPTGGPIDLDQSGAEIYATVSALAVSFMDGNVIWAGSDDGLVHVTEDGGKTWKDVTPPGLPKFTYISCIEPSHVEAGTAYLSAQRYMWDDFKPYVFKTTDYGQHWTAITNGLPDDQYTFAIRQDPDDANLLFIGTANTVYMSLDGGSSWQPLSLNLPKVQVRDVRIDTRQGDVVVATHGRAFWVLDNLTLLEQLSRQPSATSSGVALFAPQRAWLSHAYGGGGGGFRVPDAGQNPPFGATVFFDLPSGYDGGTPVTLSFTDAQGTPIRSFKLHLKQGGAGRDTAGEANLTPQQRRQRAEERLTAIQAGMNKFQWDLRYPDATEVKGFYPPVAAGGLPDEVEGPVITPGSYQVVLDYGGQKTQQSFQVSADPRLHVTPEDLQARLALELQVHGQLDTLDTTLNRAIDARDALRTAVGSRRPNKAQARALAALDGEIGNLVQMQIQSSEGSLLHETKLRSFLAYLAADIDNAYAKPTPSEYDVYTELAQEAKAGEQKLEAAIAQAKKLQPIS
jgi:photosystem II stability/assembly factor-like uncharacterized protein